MDGQYEIFPIPMQTLGAWLFKTRNKQ